MGLVHKPTLESYFQDTFRLTQTPGFGILFTRDKYKLLRSFLHFCINEEPPGKEDIFQNQEIIRHGKRHLCRIISQ